MKALIVGSVAPDFEWSINRSVARALELCGFSATRVLDYYVTTPPGLANRLLIDLPRAFGVNTYYTRYVDRFNEQLLRVYREFRPDLVLVIRGSKVAESSLRAMDSSVRAIWLPDAVHRCEIPVDRLRDFHHVFVFEASDIPWLAEHHGISAHFLPMAFEPELFHPTGCDCKDIDVFFVGAPYARRRMILERLVKDFPTCNLKFYGRYVRYREPSSWARYVRYALSGHRKCFVNRTLNPNEVNALYNRSKICINIHHEQSQDGCNPRVFEIMGARAFQLVDDVPYVREEMGSTVIRYRDYEDLRLKIAHYLDHEKEREAIAERAFEHALRSHTFVHRMKEILSLAFEPTR